MKKSLILGATCAAAMMATPVLAGSLADPVIEAPLIVEDASSSSSGTALVIALAILMSIPALTD